MYPYIMQYVAAERARELREQAAVERRAALARRARRGLGLIAPQRAGAHRPGAPRWA